MILFGAVHLVFGLAVFGAVAWVMLGTGEDEVDESDGGGGGGLHPKPRRPGPQRPRTRRGPVRAPSLTRLRGRVVRTARQPR